MTTSPTNEELKRQLETAIARQQETQLTAKKTARVQRAASGEESVAPRG